MKYLPVLIVLLACESSAGNDPFENRLYMLMRRKDSLVRVRNAEEKNLSTYEKGKSPATLIRDTIYMLKAEKVVTLDRQISFLTHEIRQVEKERLTNQQQNK